MSSTPTNHPEPLPTDMEPRLWTEIEIRAIAQQVWAEERAREQAEVEALAADRRAAQQAAALRPLHPLAPKPGMRF